MWPMTMATLASSMAAISSWAPGCSGAMVIMQTGPASTSSANSARFGADLICYITPAEHLALPGLDDVREGIRATRLAARIGDLVKYPERREQEKQAALARRDMMWQDLEGYLLFPEIARKIRAGRSPEANETCSMCGDFCAMKKGMEVFGADITDKRR